MKIYSSRLGAFFKSPPATIRAVLLYGPERGLLRERAAALAATVLGPAPDPFRLSVLTGARLSEDPALLADEAAALTFTGGRRLVRVTDIGDRHAAVFAGFLQQPAGDALIVAEAGELAKRSTLRQVFEKAANAAAIACYPDTAESLAAVIDNTIAAAGLTLGADARDYLLDRLGVDRQVTRRELEKLIAYVGDSAPSIGLDDCIACIGDSAAAATDAVIDALAIGDRSALDRALDRCLRAGERPIAILRGAQRHFHRLSWLAARREGGAELEALLGQQRMPPNRLGALRAQLRRWSSARCAVALAVLTTAEVNCKTTGLPDETICWHALLAIAGGDSL